MSKDTLAVVRPCTYPARPINGGPLDLAEREPGERADFAGSLGNKLSLVTRRLIHLALPRDVIPRILLAHSLKLSATSVRR